MEPSDLVKIEEGSELDQIWNRFLEFEDYTYDDEKTTFTGFLTEWQNRLKSSNVLCKSKPTSYAMNYLSRVSANNMKVFLFRSTLH